MAGVYKLWFATLRCRISAEHDAIFSDYARPTIFVIWHNRIALTPWLALRYRNKGRTSALISASKDGAWIAGFLHLIGFDTARGSSSKRAAAAALELMNVLRDGRDVAITPDGPRGPIYTFHEGAAALALMAKAPVTIITPNPRAGIRLPSWDGFYLPRPFSSVDVKVRRIEPEELPQERAACAEYLRAAMCMDLADLPMPARREKKKKAAK
jgi:lysophospholipid acyltransferase (LPLAT)-like uncharacterized protein